MQDKDSLLVRLRRVLAGSRSPDPGSIATTDKGTFTMNEVGQITSGTISESDAILPLISSKST
jgi:hypothetical protein